MSVTPLHNHLKDDDPAIHISISVSDVKTNLIAKGVDVSKLSNDDWITLTAAIKMTVLQEFWSNTYVWGE